MDAETMICDARRYREQEVLLGKGGVASWCLSKSRFKAG